MKRISLFLLFFILVFLLFGCSKDNTDTKYSSAIKASSETLKSENVKSEEIKRASSMVSEQISSEPKKQEPKKPINIDNITFEKGQKSVKIPCRFLNGRLFVDPLKLGLFKVNEIEKPRNLPLSDGNVKEYTIFDLASANNCKILYFYNENKITIYENLISPFKDEKIKGNKKAFIRLEDFSAGNESSPDFLAKYRAIADLFYSRGINFSVAFIPKFINPKEKRENDPSDTFSLYNCDFVYTLDYLSTKNGQIGLHGFTHQSGRDISGAGYEFGAKRKLTQKQAEEKIKNALLVAERLNIKPLFFEFPHYNATQEEFLIAEKYFNIQYSHEFNKPKQENITMNLKNSIKLSYIPTPLGFLEDGSEQKMSELLRKIKSNEDDTIASMFFHPYLEVNSINIIAENDTYKISYPENTPLKRIISKFSESGYYFPPLSDIEK